jgi:hypothetical protein
MIITPVDPDTRLRSESSTAGAILGKYQPGAKVYGGEIFTVSVIKAGNPKIGDQWMKVESINGVPISGWMAIIHDGNTICREVAQPAPPTVFEPVTATLYDVDGTARHYVLTPKQ